MVSARTLGKFGAMTTYRVTLQVAHPTLTSEEIKNYYDFPTSYARTVGKPRQTPDGKHLAGVYKETAVSFLLHPNPIDVEEQEMENFIDSLIDKVNFDFLRMISLSGGVSNFLLGVYAIESASIFFPPKIIEKLGRFSIGLSIQFYGGD